MAHASLELKIAAEHAELAADALFESGASGLEEREEEGSMTLVAYAAERAELEAIAEGVRALLAERDVAENDYQIEITFHEASDWESAYFEHLVQVEFAPGYFLRPTHETSEPPAAARVLLYEPALAFGDGSHPTTLLAARAAVERAEAHPGESVCDYGSGNGVLALVALLAGAGRALGVEVDPTSLAAAEHNAELNGLATRARFRLPEEAPSQPYDWVVANLEEPALLECAPRIAAYARRDRAEEPVLAITGFLSERSDVVLAAFEALGFFQVRKRTLEDWVLLELGVR